MRLKVNSRDTIKENRWEKTIGFVPRIGRRRLHHMVLVIKRKGETKDSMFRKFTRSFIDEEIVEKLRKKQFYKKPSLKRKEEEKERRKNRFSKHSKVFKKIYKRV